MELLVLGLIAVIVAFLLGYYASKKVFQVVSVLAFFVGSFLVYSWVDIQNTQAPAAPPVIRREDYRAPDWLVPEITLEFDLGGAQLDEAIKAHGAMPLPPYIGAKRGVEERDLVDYQTVYAANDGAVAAPTAGLHFTENLLQQLADKGVTVERVTLHVGAGTFLPMKVDDTEDHVMHAEWGELTQATVERINAKRAAGGRVIAVGTTSLRLLETASRATGSLQPFIGDTDIFITPGFKFATVDALMTNFHLPKSTLFMLVSAFAGMDLMRQAYEHAIRDGYRFYSYGDSSLLLRAEQSSREL